MHKTAFHIAQMAQKAMLYEVCATPKPGLVDKINSGAHNDMDIFTFIESTTALFPTMYHCSLAGLENPYIKEKELFKKIRHIGIQGEKDMFLATSGVNTQKGLIFILGIVCAAVGHLISNREKVTAKNISVKVSKMTRGIVDEELAVLKGQESDRKLTAGERLFLKYSVTGIRGEVEAGLPTVMNVGLKKLISNLEKLDINSALINTLLEIILVSEDTNVLWRKGKKGLDFMRERTKKALELGAMATEEGRRDIEKMDKEFIALNISPGGSADLLATTIMVYMILESPDFSLG